MFSSCSNFMWDWPWYISVTHFYMKLITRILECDWAQERVLLFWAFYSVVFVWCLKIWGLAFWDFLKSSRGDSPLVVLDLLFPSFLLPDLKLHPFMILKPFSVPSGSYCPSSAKLPFIFNFFSKQHYLCSLTETYLLPEGTSLGKF